MSTDAGALAASRAENGQSQSSDLPLRLKFAWGLGSMPMSALSVTANVLLLRFMTDSLGMSAALASLLFSATKMWDAINDPLMGVISDRLETPWGRRLPWMLGGGLLTVLVMIGMFAVPVQGERVVAVYMTVALLLFATTYTMFMIPYMALPAEISRGYHGRTQLMSFRVVFSSVGSMAGLGLGPILLGIWGATRAGHLKMAIVLGAGAAAAIIVCVWLLRETMDRTPVPREHVPLMSQLRSALENRPFIWLLVSKAMYYLMLALTLTCFAYFTKHVLQISDVWLGTLLAMKTGALIVSQPVWVWVARIFGKQRGFIFAATLFGLATGSWWFASSGDPIALAIVRVLLTGVAGGGTFLLSQAMLPDVMELDRMRTGIKREGAFAGVFVLVEKVSGALGVAFVGLILGGMGYIAAMDGARVVQPESAILALYLCMSLIPVILLGLAVAAMSRYQLTAEMLADMRKQ